MKSQHPDDNIKQRQQLRARHPNGLYLHILTGKATVSKGELTVPWDQGHDYKRFTKNAYTQCLTAPAPKGKIIGNKIIPSLTYILVKQKMNGYITASLIFTPDELAKLKVKPTAKIYLA